MSFKYTKNYAEKNSFINFLIFCNFEPHKQILKSEFVELFFLWATLHYSSRNSRIWNLSESVAYNITVNWQKVFMEASWLTRGLFLPVHCYMRLTLREFTPTAVLEQSCLAILGAMEIFHRGGVELKKRCMRMSLRGLESRLINFTLNRKLSTYIICIFFSRTNSENSP